MSGVPTVADTDASDPLNTGARFGVIVIPRVVLADNPPVSVAVSVRELVPVADGVPVIAPVPGLILNPAGKPVAV